MDQWFKVIGIVLGAGGAILLTLTRPNNSSYEVTASLFANPTCLGATASTETYDSDKCFQPSGSSAHFKYDCEYDDRTVKIYKCTDDHCNDCDNAIVTNFKQCMQPLYGVDAFSFTCAAKDAKNQLLGIIMLTGNCLSMAVYVLLQKHFVFSDKHTLKPSRWAAYPIAVTAYAYLFGALCMAAAAGIRYAINRDGSVFSLPMAAVGGLAYAVLVSSALCYGLITWCNRHVSATFTTAFWPLQVFVTVILSHFVFGDNLVGTEYGGMALIIAGMLSVSYGNYAESSRAASALHTSEESRTLINEEDGPW